MKPETAIDLVNRYSRLTKAIAACRRRIGEHLDLCNGLKGFRRETEHHEASHHPEPLGTIEAYDAPTDRSMQDQDTHLKGWYDGSGRAVRYDGEYAPIEVHKDECPHCWAAHCVVEERKVLRRQLGAVKATMTRIGDAA